MKRALVMFLRGDEEFGIPIPKLRATEQPCSICDSPARAAGRVGGGAAAGLGGWGPTDSSPLYRANSPATQPRVTWLEAIAFALGVINVTLVVRRSIWNYPFALALVTLYAAVFWQARLYSDTLLQGFFFVVNIYGWIGWRANRAAAGAIVVEAMTARSRVTWAAGGIVAALGWGALMHRYTDAALPWWDAAIAIASVAAQILMARRVWENWAVWIAVDIGSIGLYLAKGLWLTALLYAVFLVLATWGLIDWRRVMAAQDGDDPVATTPALAA